MIAESAIIPFLFRILTFKVNFVICSGFSQLLCLSSQLFPELSQLLRLSSQLSPLLSQLSNYLLIPTRFSHKKAAHRVSVGLTNLDSLIVNEVDDLFKKSCCSKFSILATFVLIIATISKIIATFSIIIATFSIIIATIQ